jgi:hypothetical protein
VAACLNRCFDPSHKNKMCGVPGAKIGHSQLCFVVIHNVIIIMLLLLLLLLLYANPTPANARHMGDPR